MKKGFSLVELSIVLVILGLLVGGILAGKSLIRASELRGITSEHQRYLTAVQAFRDKYFALPGDISNATSFWGVESGVAATCITQASTTPTTCNGNGDSIVAMSTSSNEIFRAWQHLANAGLIEGTYTGATDGTNPNSSTTNNSPRSKLSPGLWFIYNWGTLTTTSQRFRGTYNNSFELGVAGANSHPASAILKPEELWNIDTKLDDGMPGTGKIVPANYASCTDAADDTVLTAAYVLTTTTNACAIIFRQQF